MENIFEKYIQLDTLEEGPAIEDYVDISVDIDINLFKALGLNFEIKSEDNTHIENNSFYTREDETTWIWALHKKGYYGYVEFTNDNYDITDSEYIDLPKDIQDKIKSYLTPHINQYLKNKAK